MSAPVPLTEDVYFAPIPEAPWMAEPPQVTIWMRAYQWRIDQGLERCRHCGTREDIGLARLLRRGGWSYSNFTILCDHDAQQVLSVGLDADGERRTLQWRRDLPSLKDEEQRRPKAERWGRRAMDEAQAQRQAAKAARVAEDEANAARNRARRAEAEAAKARNRARRAGGTVTG